jgi:hypothetical protein
MAETAHGPIRDPFIDLLRTGSMLLVVVGHWLMPVLSRQGGTLVAGNSLATPGWWTLTWLAQVMPVFFVAGGAANALSYTAHRDRGGSATGWLVSRVRRLVRPVLVLAAVWIPLPVALFALHVPGQPIRLGAAVAAQLLWFLAVYLLTTSLTPVLLAARRRCGPVPPIAASASRAIGVDLLRLHGVPLIGYANELFVWLAVQQLGVEYAVGRLSGVRAGTALALGAGGFTATVLLVVCGGYPVSMVGIPGQSASNMSPATICLLSLGCAQLGVLLAARARLVAWSRRPRPAAVLRAVGGRCMTVYLWHMTALVLVAGVAVLGLGYRTPAPGGLAWLVLLPVWLGVLAAVLAGLLAVFGRFEIGRPAVVGPLRPGRLVAAIGLSVVGLTGLAAQGFAPAGAFGQVGPVPWTALLVLGLAATVPDPARRLGAVGTRLLAALVSALPARR